MQKEGSVIFNRHFVKFDCPTRSSQNAVAVLTEEFLQKETERMPSESTYQCESGDRLVPSDADNEPPLDKEDA